MRLLLDEMYAPALTEHLRQAGVEATTVAELGLAGCQDPDVLAAACAADLSLLTENVSDFARLAGEHSAAGLRHPGILIALSSRFSRRPSGHPALTAAVLAITDQPLVDRVIYLEATASQGRAVQ